MEQVTPIELPNTARKGKSGSKITKEKSSLARNKGSRDRRKLLARIKDEESPLEYFPRVMRDPTVPDARRDEMAKAAAPYLHPRGIAIKADKWDLSGLTDEELDAFGYLAKRIEGIEEKPKEAGWYDSKTYKN